MNYDRYNLMVKKIIHSSRTVRQMTDSSSFLYYNQVKFRPRVAAEEGRVDTKRFIIHTVDIKRRISRFWVGMHDIYYDCGTFCVIGL